MVPGFNVSGPKQLVIGSLNIHGSRNKLESSELNTWLLEHDIVFLCETMANIPLSVPGFVTFNGLIYK